MFSVQEIKELIEAIAKNRLRGLEIERSGIRLKIEGVAPAEATTTFVHVPAPAAAPATPYPAPAPRSSSATGGPSAQEADRGPSGAGDQGTAEDEGLHSITSPIVGTFYRAPGPDQEPFVKLGDRVTKGQTLCIVEAMKLMNEIEADVSGEIVKIYAQNVQPVEYGEKLFAIRPD